MRLSIIIPTLNEAGHIETALARAAALEPHEIIVADGWSDDGTRELAALSGSCRVIETARGRAVQQNAASQISTGDVLLFLHADNWLEPPAVAQIADALASSAACGGAFRQRIEAQGIGFRALESGNAWRVRLRGLAYGDQGIFLRRAAFDEVGGFPEVPFLEDLLLMRSLRRRRFRLALLPGPIHVSSRHWQRRGIVRQTLKNWSIVVASAAGVSPEGLALRR